MIEGAILKEVRDFIQKHGDAYENLAKDVREAAEKVKKQLGLDIVRDVYSRRTKQGGKTELKSTAKIAEKVWRKRHEPGNAGFKIQQLNDIVGVTIVIQYPDQVPLIRDRLDGLLKEKFINVLTPQEHGKLGYYANHIDCISEHFESSGLMCELQIRPCCTMPGRLKCTT